MKQFLAAMIVIVSGLCAKPACALYNCSDAELLSHSFGNIENSYIISWQRSEVYPTNVKMEVIKTAYGGWKKNTNVASETIRNNYRQYVNGSPIWEGENSENLSASCQEDPWLSELPCLPPESSSRTILAKTVRAYLQQQHAIQKTAPEILEPACSSSFTI